MPTMYASGDHFEEMNGTIRGGVTVVMHNSSELPNVADLCMLASTSNAPMHALYGLFNATQLPESAPSRTYNWAELEGVDLGHPAQALATACSFAYDMWRRTPDPNAFFCSLTVARPERDMRLDMDIDAPGLVFHSGSLLATVAKGPLTVFGWAVTLFPARGIGGSTRADRIVEDFRAQVLQKGGTQPLERLDNLPPDYLQGKEAVIVLLHGLLSIDAGLFDPLVQQLRADPDFATIPIVGWPHNTLAGVRDNAVQLLPIFARAIGIDGPNVAFVCHSRGGLVARAAAVELYESNPRWIQKLKACVTFGTPHNGSPLAEAPGDLMGKVVAIQAFRGGEGFLSLLDALHVVHQQPAIQGIADLKPLTGGGEFLRNLIRDEARSAPSGAERALPLFAIGGKAEQKGFFAELSRRALAGNENDLIVETSSSATRYSAKNALTECNHFEYFLSRKTQTDTFPEAIRFLKERLAIQSGTSAPAISTSQGEQRIPLSRPMKLKRQADNYTVAKPPGPQ